MGTSILGLRGIHSGWGNQSDTSNTGQRGGTTGALRWSCPDSSMADEEVSMGGNAASVEVS